MKATLTLTEFPAELARRLVSAMVHDNSEVQTVRKMLELEDEDVISAGITYAVEQWPKYDPEQARASTFIQQRANSGIYNLLRKEGVQDRLERRVGGVLHKPDKDRDLCDWLAEVYEAAKRVYVQKRMNQGRTYAMPLTVAISGLMQRENLSARGCARLLATRQDLQAVLKLKTRLPHWTTLARARHIVDRISGFHVATDTPS